MRVAIVHDWLNHKAGGAELVLGDILSMYPKADVFTLIYEPKIFSELVSDRKVKTSFLQHFPRVLKKNPKFLLPFIKRAIEGFDFTGYDLIISSSGAWSKNINVPGGVAHICYCHSPARMLWVDWPGYLDDMNFWGFKYIPFLRLAIMRMVSNLRLWDYYKTIGVTQFISNSKYITRRIKKFYGRDSITIYPGIDTEIFAQNEAIKKQNYFLVVSTLAKYKNIDVIIKTFCENKRQLVIAGTGSMEKYLQELAKDCDNIEFLGYVSNNRKIKLLQGAQGFVFSNIEDFGIAPVEALAAGTPVLALWGGGLSETIKEGMNGIFFDQAVPEKIKEAITKFLKIDFNHQDIVKSAQKFGKDNFIQNFSNVVNKISL